ncbi:soluble lytic murein transglycosylase, putative [gamma proteobacterium HTCC5015]|nr:soluble lytic murein transglycosylase, putative [gamma proteobacterium HTCC5015]
MPLLAILSYFLGALRSLSLAFFLLGFAPVAANSSAQMPSVDSGELQRVEAFREALDRGDIQRAEQWRNDMARSTEKTLSSYLDYWSMMERLKTLDTAAVRRFLEGGQLPHLQSYLRSSWLYHLAREKRWGDFVAFDDGRDNRSLRCHAARAALAVEPSEAAYQKALALWLVGFSQPKACDPVFEVLKQQGKLTEARYAERQALAIEAGQHGLARYLQRSLNDESHLFRDWQRVIAHPEAIKAPHFDRDTPVHRDLALYATRRLLRSDLEKAEAFFSRQKQRYHFSRQQQYRVEALIALRAAQRHRDDAVERMAALDANRLDEDMHAWRVRAAIRQHDWQAAKAFIGAMPEAQSQQLAWRYWLARSEEQLGRPQVALSMYQKLAQSRGYYGFLAAERAGLAYQFEDRPPTLDTAAVADFKSQSAMGRILWLRALGEEHLARVEWNRSLRGFDAQDHLVAAAVAREWGWHEMVIRSAAKAQAFDALAWRFAMPWRESVKRYSQTAGIDPNWAQAIMRRESAYNPKARSSASARGLMQLLPSTAREVARRQVIKGRLNLYDPEQNIHLGSAYLAYLKGRMHGNEILATASYNAGPHKVEAWLPEAGDMDLDIWVETIPYRETRHYVRAVTEYRSIFDWQARGRPDDYRPSLGIASMTIQSPTVLAQRKAD